MVRKLVKTLLSLLLVAPAAALALGLGEVQLHSALNQRLDADIKLLSVDPAEADTIDVSLASYEDFAKVGLERPASLMFLRFSVEQTPSGEYYIKLTSKETVREPFLDFLVEVKWRSGRVLREYTLLLDPPVSHREAAPAITAPTAGPSVAVKPAEPEEEFIAPPSSIPVAPGVKTPAAPAAPRAKAQAAPAEPRAKAPAAPARTVPAQPAAAPSGSIAYGPVKANETLWRIAQKLRPNKDVTVQQMMVALLVANPYAFIDNNINRLKKGFVLRIDDPSVLTAMSKAEAAREVSRQTREWQDYRSTVAAKASKRQAVSTTEEVPSTAVGTAKKEPKLELVVPEGKAEKPGSKAATADESVKQELMLALESSAAQRKENEELQKRVQGLEEQLKDMQRLLTLKDADLATLQKQLSEQGQALPLPSGKTEPAAPLTKPEEQAVPEAPAKAEAPATEEAGQAEQVQAPAETVIPEKPAAEVKKPEPAAKPAPKKPVAKKPVVPPPPVEEPSMVDMILGDFLGSNMLGDPIMMAAGGGVVLLILILLMVMIKRRRSGGFQESILSGGTSSMLGAKDEDESDETSFLSDLAISGMGMGGASIDTDEGEVDPITEADVFMAYGRNQQAEEVLNKALEKNPGRNELIAKLLEVYYNLKEADQFTALADKSASSLKKDVELWERIAAMGHELSPGNSLFISTEGHGGPAAKVPAGKSEPITEDVLDIGLDLDELTAEMESDGAYTDTGFDLGLDFDELGEEEVEPAADTGKKKAVDELVAEDESTFDFDLGAIDEEPAIEEAATDFELGTIEEAPAFEAADEFDLDFGSGAEMEMASEEAGLDLGELGDLDFGDLGLESSAEESAPQIEQADEDAFSLDMSGLDMEEAGDEMQAFGDLGDLDDEGLLADSDEIATKLDLAQAYIEMGDSDGARSMLEEVAEVGTDDQKQQAQELLARI